tara:strand:+ start:55 stop:1422 length:1368 start_codon:yes stop_codon:yes gene_type:complete
MTKKEDIHNLKKTIYTVSQLNQSVRQILEQQLGRVWLSGEISNLAMPHSGHWYFTLKDHQAQIRCAMFRGRNQNVRFQPQDGQQVTVRGQISVYAPRGDYQLIAESMIPDGEGLLQIQFEQLKQKLADEGLFKEEHKQSLPQVTRLGVITSATGAALSDVLKVLKRRAPHIEVIIYATAVQGDDAPKQIVHALQKANRRQEVDALLLTRGGGSAEDLSCFNHEAIARALFHSKLPVVSAVGHETDITIADFVADLRAPTPSSGAEILSEDQSQLKQQLTQSLHAMQRAWSHLYLQKNHQYLGLKTRLEKNHPRHQLDSMHQRLDEQQWLMQQKLQAYMTRCQQHLHSKHKKLIQHQPSTQVMSLSQQQQSLANHLYQAIKHIMHRSEHSLSSHAAQLEKLSPLATLSRGYSVTLSQEQTLSSVQHVQIGQEIITRLQDGKLVSHITQKEAHHKLS